MSEQVGERVAIPDEQWRATRLPTLTTLRFIAAGQVFLLHLAIASVFADPGISTTFMVLTMQGGFTGVGFFFVLSGFVLTWSARPGDRVRDFWRRRLVKIYPNHLVTFLAAALLLAAAGSAFDVWSALRSLLLIQSIFPIEPGFNMVAWSLSCEVLFYLAFPLLWRLAMRIRPERLWMWAGIVVLGVLGVHLLALTLPGEPLLPYAATSGERFWFVYFFGPARLMEFAFGIVLARIVMCGRMIPLSLGWAAALAVLANTVAPLFPMTYQITAVTVVPLGLLIAAAAVSDVSGRRTFLNGRVGVWLGEISFAFYMVHWLVVTYGVELLGRNLPVPEALGVITVVTVVALALSWAMYRGLEQPVMRRFGGSRRRPSVPAAPTS